MTLISTLAMAAMGMSFHGKAYEVYYSRECRPGPVLESRIAAGRHILVRPGNVNSGKKPVADAIVAKDGSYHLNVVGEGEFCIVPREGYGVTGPCLVQFRGAVEGSQQEDLRFAALDAKPPPSCPKVFAEVMSVVDPCGDSGKPPTPLQGVMVDIAQEGSPRAAKYGTDPNGKFWAFLPAGRHCVRVERASDPYLPEKCRSTCDAKVEVNGKSDVRASVQVHQTCGDPCVPAPFDADVSTARGLFRVAARGGTHHVQGRAFIPERPAYGCGALHPAVPERPHPGALILVRKLADASLGPVAQVMTDEKGDFDVALPEGEYCFTVGPKFPEKSCAYVAKIERGSPPIQGVKLVPAAEPLPRCPPGVP